MTKVVAIQKVLHIALATILLLESSANAVISNREPNSEYNGENKQQTNSMNGNTLGIQFSIPLTDVVEKTSGRPNSAENVPVAQVQSYQVTSPEDLYKIEQKELANHSRTPIAPDGVFYSINLLNESESTVTQDGSARIQQIKKFFESARQYYKNNKYNINLSITRFAIAGTAVVLGYLLAGSTYPLYKIVSLGLTVGLMVGGFQIFTDKLKAWLNGESLNAENNFDKDIKSDTTEKTPTRLFIENTQNKISFYTKYGITEAIFLTVINLVIVKLDLLPINTTPAEIADRVVLLTLIGTATQGFFYNALFKLTEALEVRYPDKQNIIDKFRYTSIFLGSVTSITTAVVAKSLKLEFSDAGFIILGAAGASFYALSNLMKGDSKLFDKFATSLGLQPSEGDSIQAMSCNRLLK